MWFIVLTGCLVQPDIEGHQPGECSDEADNDTDGAIDCDDPDCFGAPACLEPATDPSPEPTADTAPPPTPPSPGPRTFDVTLADGDGIADAEAPWDADTLTLTLHNPPPGQLFFGYGQTAVGIAGWFAEDCTPGADFCHPVPAPVEVGNVRRSQLVLHTVHTISEIVEGSTTLLPVDHPVSATPDVTFYIGDRAGNCFTFGDDPTYYPGCQDVSASATTNQ